jgi:hypothetical protein
MTTPAHVNTGVGRILIFAYGILALSSTARSAVQLGTKASEAPLPYALSGLAAVVYIVATWALATDRRGIALAAVGFEMVGVLVVGFTSLAFSQDYPDATVWSGFGAGYGWVPLLLPILGLWWLWNTRPRNPA